MSRVSRQDQLDGKFGHRAGVATGSIDHRNIAASRRPHVDIERAPAQQQWSLRGGSLSKLKSRSFYRDIVEPLARPRISAGPKRGRSTDRPAQCTRGQFAFDENPSPALPRTAAVPPVRLHPREPQPLADLRLRVTTDTGEPRSSRGPGRLPKPARETPPIGTFVHVMTILRMDAEGCFWFARLRKALTEPASCGDGKIHGDGSAGAWPVNANIVRPGIAVRDSVCVGPETRRACLPRCHLTPKGAKADFVPSKTNPAAASCDTGHFCVSLF